MLADPDGSLARAYGIFDENEKGRAAGDVHSWIAKRNVAYSSSCPPERWARRARDASNRARAPHRATLPCRLDAGASNSVQRAATSRASLAHGRSCGKKGGSSSGSSSIREIVFGVQDGVLTTAGVLCGFERRRLTSILRSRWPRWLPQRPGALSWMRGLRGLSGGRCRKRVLRRRARPLVRADAAEKPYTVQEGLLDELCKEGPHPRSRISRRPACSAPAPRALESTAEAKKCFGLGRPRCSVSLRSMAS